MSHTPDLLAVMDECRRFPGQFKSLHLATCTADGHPEASYAAYVAHQGSYYVYTSELSAHTANLAANGRCSVLFIESEAEAKHLFARKRLTLQCAATECPRGCDCFELIMDLFVGQLGGFMALLRKMNDFHLYRLRPLSGAYVAGFAQAYTLQGEGLSEIRRRNEQGHRSADPATTQALDEVAH